MTAVGCPADKLLHRQGFYRCFRKRRKNLFFFLRDHDKEKKTGGAYFLLNISSATSASMWPSIVASIMSKIKFKNIRCKAVGRFCKLNCV